MPSRGGRGMRAVIGMIAVLGVSAPTPLSAQGAGRASVLEPGDRLRFIAPPHYPTLIESRLVALGADTMRAEALDGNRRYLVPVSDLSLLERRRLKEHTWTGAAIGTGTGLVLSGLFLWSFCGGDTSCQFDEYARAGAIITIPTALAGAFVGSLFRTARWEPVDLHGSQPPTR